MGKNVFKSRDLAEQKVVNKKRILKVNWFYFCLFILNLMLTVIHFISGNLAFVIFQLVISAVCLHQIKNIH